MKVFKFFIYCLQRFLWLCFPRCFINNTVFNIICVAIRFRVNLHYSYDIWCASDCNRIWRHNHLVGKGTLNHLAMLGQYFNQIVEPCVWPVRWPNLTKWLSVCLWTKWLWVPVAVFFNLVCPCKKYVMLNSLALSKQSI